MKSNILASLLIIVLLSLIGYYFLNNKTDDSFKENLNPEETSNENISSDSKSDSLDLSNSTPQTFDIDKDKLPEYVLSEKGNSIWFDTSNFSTKANAIKTPDGSKIALIDNTGLIVVKDFKTSEMVKIDVLNGSTTIPGFTVPDYSKKVDNWYENKVYYHGAVVFIDNTSILYPVPNNEYVIKNINSGEEISIKGRVEYVFEDKYFVYQKDVSNPEGIERQYVLYRNNSNDEIKFFNMGNTYKRGLRDFNYCNDIISFVEVNGGWPQSENQDFTYYTFDVLENNLKKIGESNNFQPDEYLLNKINSCK